MTSFFFIAARSVKRIQHQFDILAGDDFVGSDASIKQITDDGKVKGSLLG